jgi:hypothetical protein
MDESCWRQPEPDSSPELVSLFQMEQDLRTPAICQNRSSVSISSFKRASLACSRELCYRFANRCSLRLCLLPSVTQIVFVETNIWKQERPPLIAQPNQFVQKVRFQRTSTRWQWGCAKTQVLRNRGNHRTQTSADALTCIRSSPDLFHLEQELACDPSRP